MVNASQAPFPLSSSIGSPQSRPTTFLPVCPTPCTPVRLNVLHTLLLRHRPDLEPTPQRSAPRKPGHSPYRFGDGDDETSVRL